MSDESSKPNGAAITRPKRRGRALALALLLVLVLVVTGWVVVRFALSPVSATPRQVEFEVLPGWGGARVAGALHDAGLVRSGFAFELLLRFTDLDRRVGEGLYDLSPSMSSRELANALAAGGRPRTVRIVVPEGWRATAVVARLAANGLGEEPELAALVRSPGELAPPGLAKDDTLEGYLFPASYDLPVHSTASEALGAMVARFEAEVTGPVVDALAQSGLSVHDWVTLASMVQAEAASVEEMPIIAGVFLNRLDDGMLLQSDPTVAYGLGKALPDLSAVAGDLRKDTPWNTYTRPGLPAGPIGNPGQEALLAVLSPERLTDAGVPYLYFLHGSEGGVPVFRPNTNLPAHNRDVQRFLRGGG
ncbi:MAG TPA: endolytic transglycosylase MltG [Trueperaceae bacterium]|nr:endolytic transglycosylase MltG [Trueperaceae bacterium]